MVDMSLFPRGDPERPERSNISPHATWLAANNVVNSAHWQYDEGNIFLGELNGVRLGVCDNRHMVTIAGSRAGKGVSAIIPNLLLYPGSVLCIDPKGENARVTAQRRRDMGHNVHVLDPFRASGQESASFNPLDMIDMNQPSCVDDAALIADALIVSQGNNDAYFTSAARNWLRGLILFICAEEKPERRNLMTLRKLLTLSAEDTRSLLRLMIASEEGYGIIARAAGAIDQKESRELSGVFSTAIEQTEFLDSPAMRHVLERSDFKLADLKTGKTSIYLCLPAMRMATHSRWLRIFINLAMESFERPPSIADGPPVLVIMDEFPILGHLESVEKAAGLIAGFGVCLWTIIQDLSQLKRHYKESWETFMGNAGLLQVFGNADLTTLKYVSERLGQTTVATISESQISKGQAMGGFSGESVSYSTVPLMTTDEVARFFSRQSRAQILLWSGSNPIAADRVEYFSHPFFEGLFSERG